MSDTIVYPLKKLLTQLQQLLANLDDSAYSMPVAVLSDASLGKHTRHVVECLMALDRGYETGRVNYDLRKRDKQMEDNRAHGLMALGSITGGLERPDKPLWLVTDFNPHAGSSHLIATNYARELVHNLEHIVHHMALIRIGVHAITDLQLPEDFGVALSTLRHKKLSNMVSHTGTGARTL